ncbi:MAG TPA: peptidase M1, partial [Terriglobales bacterium]
MIRRTVLFCLAVAAVACAQAPEGIPRQLARERAANISDVRYKLSFQLAPKTPDVPGTVEVTFALKNAQDTLLDYRDGSVKSVTINSKTADARTENGHIVLSEALLRTGANIVRIEFTSHVAAAGKPIIRYEDKDDGSEYIYTLFVPMDASMAFPCFDQPDIKARFALTIDAPANWTIVSNAKHESDRVTLDLCASAPGEPAPDCQGVQRSQFAETRPISTYLLAFAAGPFQKIERAGMPTV